MTKSEMNWGLELDFGGMMPESVSPSEYYDDLYELLRKFTDNNIKEVVDWVLQQRNQKPFIDFPFRDLRQMFAIVKKWKLEKRSINYYSISDIKRVYTNSIRTYLNNTDKYLLDIAFKNSDIPSIKRIIEEINTKIKNDIEAENYQYEIEKEKYLQDTQKLITDIVEILRKEYENRIIETKKAIVKYIEPHKNALNRLNIDLASVDEALKNINDEKLLSKNDKKAIEQTLTEKQKEMLNIKRREEDNIINTKAFIEEIKKAQKRFNDMIQLLEKKNLEATTRKGYVSLIAKLEARIPELDNLFQDLSYAFKKDISNIRDSFYLLNMSIKDDLIKSLEDQQRIGEILGISGKTVMNSMKETKATLDNIKDDNVYDIDLSFLDLGKRYEYNTVKEE